MKPFLRRLLIAAAAALGGSAAYAQTTSITATGQQWGGVPLAQGQVILFGVTPNGKPQTFSANGKLYPQGDPSKLSGGFAGTIINGALTTTLAVPDKAGASAAYPLCYDVQVLNTSTKSVIDLGTRCDITGTSVSLDSFVPPVVTPTYVSASPPASLPAHCAIPALYVLTTTNHLYACGTDGVFHDQTGTGGPGTVGPKGADGVSPVFNPTVAVTPLAAGVAATASIDNTNPAQPKLSLGLPSGATGASPVLTVAPTVVGAAGSQPSVAISGAGPNFTLTFTLPAGASGSGTSIALKTGGTANGSQSILNLVAGTGVSLVDNGSGTVTIAVPAGTYDAAGAAASVASNLATETTRAQGAESTNATSISNEVTAGGTAVTAEQARATAAEGANTTAIGNEVTARGTAVTEEQTRATAAEGANATAIGNGVTARGTAVSNEATARAAADALLVPNTPAGVKAALGYTPQVSATLPATNLLAWYQFNETSGAVLTDYSGNANNGTITIAPVMNGQGYDATAATVMNGQGYDATAATSAIALPQALNASNTYYFTVYLPPVITGTVSNNNPVILGTSSTTAGSSLRIVEGVASAGVSAGVYATSLYNYSNGPIYYGNEITAGEHTIAVVCGAGVSAQTYIDGVLNNGGAGACNNAQSALAVGAGTFLLGGTAAFQSNLGVIYHEAAFYSGVHSAATVAQVSSTLAAFARAKGVAFLPVPNGNTVTPLLVAMADSIGCGAQLTGGTVCGAGTTSSNSFIALAAAAAANVYTPVNFAVPGAWLQSGLAALPYTAGPYGAGSGGNNIFVNHYGTNNIAGGQTPAQT